MRAMVLPAITDLDRNPAPLRPMTLPDPVPGEGDILVRVTVCGVCHTELDEIEGRTPPPKLPVVPGHEIVGHVEAMGRRCRRFALGQRVGVGWIHSSNGAADENLSSEFCATGRDVNGGYADLVVVPEHYAYPIPKAFSDSEAAPLLCAGGVGYRSLMLAGISDGDILGLTGFGGSGHLVLQLARHVYPGCKVFVFARSDTEREFALELGANWAGDTTAVPPEAPHAIIDTTPAWKPVLAALQQLRPGGRLVINTIRKEAGDRDLLAEIRYEDHLWMEKEIKTVANVTHHDIAAFLPIAAQIPLHVEVEEFALEDANEALLSLRRGHVRGAKVLRVSPSA
jgi:propanol-preferring alcohol dehydrogenase